MSEHVVRLSFPAKADYLLLARLALSGIGRTTTLTDELLADLKLALTEACGNCVRHAYPDGPGDVSVAYALDDRTIEIVVEDQGIGLDPAVKTTRTSDEGGMGMSIIRTIVDELEIRPGANGRGTIVRMTKRLSTPSASAAGAPS
jgi:serine/threonine-protein kinase RsbW